jgi:hypothetical protein
MADAYYLTKDIGAWFAREELVEVSRTGAMSGQSDSLTPGGKPDQMKDP